MVVDVLVLNSGEWLLTDELEATPWHILIYRQKYERHNELHLWLPREGKPGDRGYAFKRYWQEEGTRWCVELRSGDGRGAASGIETGGLRHVRFTAADGRVLWTSTTSSQRLGDFTDVELRQLRSEAAPGPYTFI